MIQFLIELPPIESIKEKRRIVSSLKEKLYQKFRLSVAEVDLLDSLRYAQIGAALVSNSKKFGESVMHKALALVENHAEGRLESAEIFSETYSAGGFATPLPRSCPSPAGPSARRRIPGNRAGCPAGNSSSVRSSRSS